MVIVKYILKAIWDSKIEIGVGILLTYIASLLSLDSNCYSVVVVGTLSSTISTILWSVVLRVQKNTDARTLIVCQIRVLLELFELENGACNEISNVCVKDVESCIRNINSTYINVCVATNNLCFPNESENIKTALNNLVTKLNRESQDSIKDEYELLRNALNNF